MHESSTPTYFSTLPEAQFYARSVILPSSRHSVSIPPALSTSIFDLSFFQSNFSTHPKPAKPQTAFPVLTGLPGKHTPTPPTMHSHTLLLNPTKPCVFLHKAQNVGIVAARGYPPSQCIPRPHSFRKTVKNVERSMKMGRRCVTRAAAVEKSGSVSATVPTPTVGETARTVVEIVSHGTLSTVSEDGTPLGTYVTYVLDEEGQPILRLRADAVHTQNLLRSQHCSLFVQPDDLPARRLARVTLLGAVSAIPDAELPEFRAKHKEVHGSAVGVDAVQESDLLYRLDVDRCFYVGGLGSMKSAETVSKEEYAKAEPDPLRKAAPEIVAQWNKDRAEDVLRICKQESGVSLLEMSYAEMMWVDQLGMYIDYGTDTGSHSTIRVAFPRKVEDDRDARSIITMTAQLAWERDRNYIPIIPPL